MKKQLIIPDYTEFSRILRATTYCLENDIDVDSVYVLVLEEFQNMFSVFKNKIVVKHNFGNFTEELHKRTSYQNIVNRDDLIREVFPKKIDEMLKEIFQLNNLKEQDFEITNLFLSFDGFKFISDVCKYYHEDKIKITNSGYKVPGAEGRKYVCINGRNVVYKHLPRNDLMIDVINFLYQKILVVDCTFPAHKGYDAFYKSGNYIQMDMMNYSDMISVFNNSIYVIALEDAGGVTNHILSDANFILMRKPGGFVDNLSLGYEGKTLLDYKRQKGFYAEKIDRNDYKRLAEILNL